MKTNQEPKYDAVEFPDGDTRLVNRASMEAIPDDEPVFIFRARDNLAVSALSYYLDAVEDRHHRAVVASRIAAFTKFAALNPDRMKSPDTDSSYPL